MIPLFFKKSLYSKRRKDFSENLEPGRDLCVLFTQPERTRSFDGHFPFRPDNNFLYLTGFAEPQSVMLLWREDGAPRGKSSKIIFKMGVLPRDRTMEQWNGYRYGVEGAKKLCEANDAFDFSELKTQIQNWLSQVPSPGKRPRIFSNCFEYPEWKIHLDRIVENFHPPHRSKIQPLEGILDCRHWIGKSRLVKSKEEIENMRKSSDINVQAHLEVMKGIRPGMMEYEAQALAENVFVKNGAANAYNSICATGSNATILHYNFNSSRMKEGQLFLIDAGCEYQFFTSDITRTLPVSGKYSDKQRALMEIVSAAQQTAFKMSKPGQSLAKIHESVSDTLIDGLKDLKIMKGKTSAIRSSGEHRVYYPHGTGHWLGMDVHDACPYLDSKGNPLKLETGMIFTVEPGLYFLKDEKSVSEEWRGLGVRIEDDILITSRGYENLTEDLPRTANEIEKFMKRKNSSFQS